MIINTLIKLVWQTSTQIKLVEMARKRCGNVKTIFVAGLNALSNLSFIFSEGCHIRSAIWIFVGDIYSFQGKWVPWISLYFSLWPYVQYACTYGGRGAVIDNWCINSGFRLPRISKKRFYILSTFQSKCEVSFYFMQCKHGPHTGFSCDIDTSCWCLIWPEGGGLG